MVIFKVKNISGLIIPIIHYVEALFVLVILLTISYPETSLANTNDIINREIKRRDAAIGWIRHQDVGKAASSLYGNDSLKSIIRELKQKSFTRLPQKLRRGFIDKTPRAMLFVSFGEPYLEKILEEAERYNIPVVIRGLYKNSFKKTVVKIFDIVKKTAGKNKSGPNNPTIFSSSSKKQGVLINPIWFRRFNIKVVPALVVQEKQQKVGSKKSKFDVIYGNIHIDRALEIIMNQGDAKKTAKAILDDYKRSQYA